MNGTQSLVGFGGAGLVFANFWFGGNRASLSGGLFGKGSTSAAHSVLLTLGGEMLLVLVLTVLAGVSDGLGSVFSVLIVGLWILWAMHHFAGGASPSTSSSKGATTA